MRAESLWCATEREVVVLFFHSFSLSLFLSSKIGMAFVRLSFDPTKRMQYAYMCLLSVQTTRGTVRRDIRPIGPHNA